MLRLAKRSTTPPGGFRYIDADTDYRFKAPTMQQLVKKVAAHRHANELDIPSDIYEIIEDWICRRLPKGLCLSPNGRVTHSGVAHRTAEASVRATMLISRINKKLGRGPVDEATSNTRAKFCI